MKAQIKDIITGGRAFESIMKDAKSGSPKQAYIFEGMKGIGKFTAAQLFAYAVHCTGSVKPCFSCNACKMHMAGTHSDFFVIGEDAKIKVSDIRALSDELYIKPALSDKKIFVIKNADKMNSAAQNALLKSFEEPPSYGIIILLSENVSNLLPTIRSRGVRIVFEPFSVPTVERYIKKYCPQKAENASFIARYSGGIIGKALEICDDDEFFGKRTDMFKACAALTGDKISIIELSEVFEAKSGRKGFEKSTLFFELFLSFIRDAIAFKTKAEIINSDKAELIEDFSSKVTLEALIRVTDRTAELQSQINASMKYELWIFSLLIHCWEDIHGKSNRS